MTQQKPGRLLAKIFAETTISFCALALPWFDPAKDPAQPPPPPPDGAMAAGGVWATGGGEDEEARHRRHCTHTVFRACTHTVLRTLYGVPHTHTL